MTLPRWEHVGGLVAATAGTVFATAFGGAAGVVAGYSLAVALGAVLYRQSDTYATVGPVSGNVLVGYLGGIGLSVAVTAGLFVHFYDAPVDYAAWQSGLLLWDSWAGVGVALLAGFFVAGLAAMLD